MNIVKPPNTEKALSYIQKFPKINGRAYYEFSDLYFPDFEMVIVEEDGRQSYKTYYLHKFYETLLSHLVCLKQETDDQEGMRDLMLGSILKESELYKYTEHQEMLEQIFQRKGRE